VSFTMYTCEDILALGQMLKGLIANYDPVSSSQQRTLERENHVRELTDKYIDIEAIALEGVENVLQSYIMALCPDIGKSGVGIYAYMDIEQSLSDLALHTSIDQMPRFINDTTNKSIIAKWRLFIGK
jgi:hypothetical protein